MGFFNDLMVNAFKTGNYYCPKCGGLMSFEDDYEETLICDECGYDMDVDHYGFTDEEYDDLYPTYDEVIAREQESKKKKKK